MIVQVRKKGECTLSKENIFMDMTLFDKCIWMSFGSTTISLHFFFLLFVVYDCTLRFYIYAIVGPILAYLPAQQIHWPSLSFFIYHSLTNKSMQRTKKKFFFHSNSYYKAYIDINRQIHLQLMSIKRRKKK